MGHDQVGRVLRLQQNLRSAFIPLHSSIDSSFCNCVLLAQDKIQTLRVAVAETFGFDTFTASRSCFVTLMNVNDDTLEIQNKKGLGAV